MGDLIQMLPALTDAKQKIPDIKFDWVIEESFQDVAKVHPSIDRIITLSYRKWKGRFLSALFLGEFANFFKLLRKERYAMVIDAQSNIKSSLVTLLARGKKYGLDKTSVREYGAQFIYHKTIHIDRDQNHLLRMRKLLAMFLGYSVPNTTVDYGVNLLTLPKLTLNLPQKFVFITHIASRENKLWPLIYWDEVIEFILNKGYEIVLPWFSEEEKARSLRLKKARNTVHLLPNLGLLDKMSVLKNAKFAVSLDTGLGHMAASLNIPNVSLNGPSNSRLTGPLGHKQILLDAHNIPCAPCYRSKCHYKGEAKYTTLCLESITPKQVIEAISLLLEGCD